MRCERTFLSSSITDPPVSSGKVYVGLNVCTGDLLAVKQIDFDNITREEVIRYFLLQPALVEMTWNG